MMMNRDIVSAAQPHSQGQLYFWIALSKVIVILIVLFSGIGLMPDEAQYWTWSRELSYGYYSKPPGIAWQIALGTWLFGDSELGVRSMSILLSFILSLAIYKLAKVATLDHQKAFWTAIAFSYCPLGLLSGFFATTDCAYVLFWTLGVYFALKQPPSYVALGITIALGALWKWPIYALWLPVVAFYFRDYKKILLGVAISLAGLVPSFIWNLEQGFPTFQHVASSIDFVAKRASPNTLEFLGAQVALVSPLLFALMVVAFVRFSDKALSLRFCWWTTVAFLGTIFLASFFEKVQGNWAVAAYPTAFVIMGRFAPIRWLFGGVVVSCVLFCGLFFIPKFYLQGLGLHNIKPALIASGYDVQKDFLFSDRYQATSLLSFYGPEKKRAFFFNIHALRHNQFDFWPTMQNLCLGQTGYFVEFMSEKEAKWGLQRFQEQLQPYFAKVTILPPQPIYQTKVALILRCEGYNGLAPPSTNKY